MQCRIYSIQGRVQGVGFRWSTLQKARELKISGTVKNLSNGEVELFACGDTWQLEQLENWLNNGGPKFSKIVNISAENVSIEVLPIGFEII
ncbi:MAG: acylphosphatase [Patescibacteria group bacterium]